MLADELLQSFAIQRTTIDHALIFAMVNHFPALRKIISGTNPLS